MHYLDTKIVCSYCFVLLTYIDDNLIYTIFT